MLKKIFTVVCTMIMTVVGSAWAQTPNRLQQFEAWGAYSYKAPDNMICYILSVPLKADPTTVKHGDNFFLVTKRFNSPVSFEPQFIAGYPLKEGSKVTVTIKDKNFDFFTKDSSAWLTSSGMEKQLVAAMRSGADMTVRAISKRGTHTTYTYSLKGVKAALNMAQKCH